MQIPGSQPQEALWQGPGVCIFEQAPQTGLLNIWGSPGGPQKRKVPLQTPHREKTET